MKAIVIGRHTGEIPDVEVIATKAVTYPATAQETADVVASLMIEAAQNEACLLFQAVPAQLAVALWKIAPSVVKLGAIVNKPSKREAGVQMTRHFETVSCQNSPADDHASAEELVKFANPNAKVTTIHGEYNYMGADVTVTVDPPMKFEFSHIEWFN